MSEDTASLERRAQQQEILTYCQVPHTIEDIAAEFEWHVQTARLKVYALRDTGHLRSVARKDSRRKRWQATTLASQATAHQGILIMTTRSTVLMRDLMGAQPSRRPVGNVTAQCLAYLYRRAYYKAQDQDDVLNVAKQGSLDPLIEVRTAMEKLYESTMVQAGFLERMLLDLPEMWQTGGAMLKLLGPLHIEQVEEKVGDFESWVRGVLGQ